MNLRHSVLNEVKYLKNYNPHLAPLYNRIIKFLNIFCSILHNKTGKF